MKTQLKKTERIKTMRKRINYPHKVRRDFLHDVVRELVKQRQRLGITQDELNHILGVADRLVSHWECGIRSPTAFHLYCWADALESKLAIIPKQNEVHSLVNQLQREVANDNSCVCKTPVNDNNEFIVSKPKVKLANKG